MDEKMIKDYLPLAIAFFTFFLGYIVSLRYKKLDRFYTQIQENLKEICSPMYHEIRDIFRARTPEDRDRVIDTFFQKYSSRESGIYKIGNNFLLEWYFMMEDSFYNYKSNQTDKNWEEFWLYFYRFNVMLKSEYWSNFRILYYEFRWLRNIWGTNNYLFRFIKETTRFIIDSLNFLVGVILILFSYMIYTKIIGKFKISNEYVELIAVISIFVFVLWGFMMIVGSFYYSLMKITLKKSIFRKLIESVVPNKYAEKFEYHFGHNSKKLLKKIKVPPKSDFF